MSGISKKYESSNSEILKQHKEGFSNRKIASILGIGRDHVNSYIRGMGLQPNGTTRGVLLESVKTPGLFVCTKCDTPQPIDEFLVMRRGQKHEYRLTYCTTCRRAQLTDMVNRSIRSYLGNKVNRTRARSKELGVSFDITSEFLLQMYEGQEGLCFYTGEEMSWGVGKGLEPSTLSLDRVDPFGGYTRDNTVLCTMRVNQAKHNFPLKDVKKWMPLWYRKLEIAGFLERNKHEATSK